MKDWKYYNNAWIPACEPHQTPDLLPLQNGTLWQQGGVLARYTTDYDCSEPTEWWYIIKDDVFDGALLKSKHRYVIRQGVKNFDVKTIDPSAYKEQLFRVTVQAYEAYPKKYRPTINKETFFAEVETWTDGGLIYGAFLRETQEMEGYALLHESGKCLHFNVLKTVPAFEKLQVNAAIVFAIVSDYESKFLSGCYICDGAKSILHETHFQDYLEKYFLFRKAYCKLRITYNPKYKQLIRFLYVFRKIFYRFDRIGLIHKLNGIFKMEEIVRKQEKGSRKYE